MSPPSMLPLIESAVNAEDSPSAGDALPSRKHLKYVTSCVHVCWRLFDKVRLDFKRIEMKECLLKKCPLLLYRAAEDLVSSTPKGKYRNHCET